MFYGLPVVQLMVTYQEMSNSTGNQGCTQLKANFGPKFPVKHKKTVQHKKYARQSQIVVDRLYALFLENLLVYLWCQ